MEKPKIFVQRINGPPSPAVPARLSYAAHGPGCVITIQTADGLALRLAATHHSFLAVLGPMLEAMRRDLRNDDPEKAGVIHAEAEPDPAAAPRQWTRRKPQAHDLTGEPGHDWPLFAARFGNSPDLLDVMIEFFKEHYKIDPLKLVAQPNAEPGPAQPDTLAADLAAVLATDPAGLRKPDGSANQSEIARRLGIANAGGYRPRIIAVAEALQASTTTNAGPGQSPATTKTEEPGRRSAA